ncbi:hypothetical protein HMPREF1567_2444 [Providencia alcalifaciens PAL-2]|nr:hypothetical protein HMPREF1562_2478 [Providencia alcalifaciens F90-2004]EUC94249.1 hypothetical protein HMPREF1567_2444 [Providencia alcalifaciens PAL-2]
MIELLNEDEWMIIWLLARGLNSENLSIVFGSNKNAVDQSREFYINIKYIIENY